VTARSLGIFVLLVAAPLTWADDFLWLEREWISDADATMAANPQLEKLDEATYAKLKSVFGEMRWQFSDGMFVVTRDGSTEPSAVPYFIKPVDSAFEIVYELDGHQSVFSIQRTAAGFCTRLVPDWIPDDLEAWKESVITECFKPYSYWHGEGER
jgi:hypothetical protein